MEGPTFSALTGELEACGALGPSYSTLHSDTPAAFAVSTSTSDLAIQLQRLPLQTHISVSTNA